MTTAKDLIKISDNLTSEVKTLIDMTDAKGTELETIRAFLVLHKATVLKASKVIKECAEEFDDFIVDDSQVEEIELVTDEEEAESSDYSTEEDPDYVPSQQASEEDAQTPPNREWQTDTGKKSDTPKNKAPLP